MDPVWVISLITALVFTRPNLNEATGQLQCVDTCPPGFYKSGECGLITKYNCKRCAEGTYTEINNTSEKCKNCHSCAHNVKVKANCTNNSDVVCKCKEGYFSQHGECEKCSTAQGPRNKDYEEKCVSSPRTPAPPPGVQVPPKLITTISTARPAPQTKKWTSSTTQETPNPSKTEITNNHNLLIWNYLVAAVVASVILFWFLVLVCRSPLKKERYLPCWNAKKDLDRLPQEPKLNEERSHHCSSPTTLSFKISEETPMIPLGQGPFAYRSGHLQHAVHTDVRRYEHSNKWPAIVLYEIIKEVPLRRWKEFLRLLSVPDQQMERVELETGLGSIEKQYQMLRLWSQRSSASLKDVYSSLHHMDLSGCAQQLQENLQSLQWSCEPGTTLTV